MPGLAAFSPSLPFTCRTTRYYTSPHSCVRGVGKETIVILCVKDPADSSGNVPITAGIASKDNSTQAYCILSFRFFSLRQEKNKKKENMSEPTATHFSFPEEEEKVLAYWDEIDAFHRSLDSTGQNSILLLDGPPFATGTPHYGHFLSSTIKDIVPKT